jgi:parvulin-like peptidyl-prolyl isomerase
MKRRTVGIVMAASLVAIACDDRQVVAKVGGTRITRSELEISGRGRTDSPERALEALVARALLAEGARGRDLEEDPVIAARIAAARREVLANALLDQVSRSATDEATLKARYEADREKLTLREVRVAQIVVRFAADDARSRAGAQAKINALYARAREGTDFAELAREGSEDAVTAAAGGDLGTIREGQVDAGFFEAAWKLKAGEVSPPFATAFGLHLVKALEEPRKVVPPFEQVRGQLAAALRREAEERILAELREDIPVRTYPERLSPREAAR